jgi:hypothetical protein
MDVKIDLTRDDSSCLSDHVPADSPLRRIFAPPQLVDFAPPRGGMPLTNDVRINCTREEANALLAIAEQYCREAVDPIREGIKLAGS